MNFEIFDALMCCLSDTVTVVKMRKNFETKMAFVVL